MSVPLRGCTGAALLPRATGVAVLVSAVSGSAGFWPAVASAEQTAAPSALIGGYGPAHGFFVASPDGENRLRAGLDAIYKLEPRTLNGEWQNRDAIYAARPFLSGTVWVVPAVAFWSASSRSPASPC